jgi:type VI secretion system FHA domain protein
VLALRVTRRPGATEPDPTAMPLPADGLTIGRGDDCGLVLADPLRLVSRQHALVLEEDGAARVRCISASAPVWVNDAQLDPGGDRALRVGDRLRIARFELAVEPAASAAPPRSRLDRWFDLDGAPDPLAPGSPLPDLPAQPPASMDEPDRPSTGAVVSWQSGLHAVDAPPPVAVPAPSPLAAAPAAAHAREAAPPAPVAAAKPVPARKAARRAPDPPPASRDLAEAFARGAGIRADGVQLTPEFMEHLGSLLRATAEGTLALLQSRAVAKRHMRAEGTHITPRQNNPLKFSPDATEALTRMLQREAAPGFLEPVDALRDAHRDLLVHQVAMVAGMRAAVFELFSRLGPEAAESAEGPAHGAARLPMVRAAALWQRHCLQHARLIEHLDDDFEAIFGREFLRAYEAQSRAATGADPASPETS